MFIRVCVVYTEGAIVVGCSLEGSVMTTWVIENSRLYGSQSITASDILLGSLAKPPAATTVHWLICIRSVTSDCICSRLKLLTFVINGAETGNVITQSIGLFVHIQRSSITSAIYVTPNFLYILYIVRKD